MKTEYSLNEMVDLVDKGLITNFVANEYIHKQWLEKMWLYSEVKTYFPCEFISEVNNVNGQLQWETSHTYLTCDVKKLSITFGEYSKKYGFHLFNPCFVYQFLHLSNTNVSACFEMVEKPQNIGKLSTKKIQSWVDYYKQVIEKMSALNAKHRDVKDVFLQKIKDLPINWHKDLKSGYMDKGGLNYRFVITDYGVDEYVTLNSGHNKLDDFLKISDNKINALT